MLVFIIPVKSSAISQDWSLFSKLFERCIKSVCSQTSSCFKVIVVCNEKPETNFDSPYIDYVMVDFAPPGSEKVSTLVGLQSPKEKDKAQKILAGLKYARKYDPTHTMVVDADDCIHRDLAKFVEQNPDGDGWFIKKGYVYKEGKKYIFLNRQNFNHLCGTSIIVKSKWSELLIDDGKHYDHCADSLNNGIKLQPLPFAGAVYSIENRENYRMTAEAVRDLKSDSSRRGIREIARKLAKYRLYILTNSIRRQFGLYKIVV